MSAGEDRLYGQIQILGLPLPERQYRFAPPRRFKFDFAYISHKLAIEVDGGIWSKGRHSRPSGIIKDMEKFNIAAQKGWRVLKFTTEQVKSGFALNMIEQVLKGEI